MKNMLYLTMRKALHYLFPTLLFVAAIAIAIIAPINYYYINNMFIIHRAAVTVIPLWIILTFLAILINRKWITFLKNQRIIK